MANLKELSHREDRLAGGHRLCAGCGASIAVRQILLGAGEDPTVAALRHRLPRGLDDDLSVQLVADVRSSTARSGTRRPRSPASRPRSRA